jgi:hypothetical protein
MPTSPSVLNYSVLKGIITFTPEGGSVQDLGNAPEVELTPEIDKLDHFSSRAGVRSKDRSVVREKILTLRVVLDEITAYNLRLALLGGPLGAGSGGGDSFAIFEQSEIAGSVTFTGTNTIGNQINLTLPSVTATPTAAINLISEEWGTLEITFDVLFVEALQDFGTLEIIDTAGSA